MFSRIASCMVVGVAVASGLEDTVGRNATDPAAPKSAAEKKKMEAAKKNVKVMEKKVTELKKQEASIKKKAATHTTKAKEADDKIKELHKASVAKTSKCKTGSAPAAPAVDVGMNVGKAKAAAQDEAGKRSKKEHDAVVKHAKDTADKASKALLAEEHDALHGKLMKEVLKIATSEATKYAPKAAVREVAVLHKKIAADVKQEVYVLVKKDATVVARALAMKEVQDQADKSGKVKALVASVAKDAAKYFAHKFSKTEVTKLAAEEAKKHVKERVANHTEIEIGKAQADAKKKVAAAGKNVAKKAGKVVKKVAKTAAPVKMVKKVAKPAAKNITAPAKPAKKAKASSDSMITEAAAQKQEPVAAVDDLAWMNSN